MAEVESGNDCYSPEKTMRGNDHQSAVDASSPDQGASAIGRGATSRSSNPAVNVCLASPFFHPEYSGGAMRFYRYLPGLRARGVAVDVVAAEIGAWKRGRDYSSLDQDTPTPTPQPADDTPVDRVPLPLWPIPARADRWRTKWVYESAILARCRGGSVPPDLLIWRYGLSLASVRVLRALRRMGIPMMRIATMYDDLAATSIRRRIRRSLKPVPYGYLDCVVVGSSVMRQNLRNLGVQTRIEVIPHGVNLDRFRPGTVPPSQAPARSRLGLAPDSEIVLFVGPITQRKGLDYLAAAWDRVAACRPRAHLVLVGPEPITDENRDGPSFAEALRRRLSRGRGAERVIFAGRVLDVEEYFRAADLFVFPSRKEGMPNVVCEAFATGLPCILTPFVGLPDEFGRAGEQYALVPHSSEALAGTILDLLADESARFRLGHAARQWAETQLDVERTLDRYAGLFRELAGRGRHGRR
jgi:glycosyltransferase involved in cell wall biosynthesis